MSWLIILLIGIHTLLYCICVIDGVVFWVDPKAVAFKETNTYIYDKLGIRDISVVLLIPLVLLVSISFSISVYWLFLEVVVTKKVKR